MGVKEPQVWMRVKDLDQHERKMIPQAFATDIRKNGQLLKMWVVQVPGFLLASISVALEELLETDWVLMDLEDL